VFVVAVSTAKCEVLMTVSLKAQIFWDISLCDRAYMMYQM